MAETPHDVKLGAAGIEEIIEVQLSPEEKAALDSSTAAVKDLVDTMHNRAASA